jgi:hypothetical protein
LAVKEGHDDAVKVMLDHGRRVSINAKTKVGRSFTNHFPLGFLVQLFVVVNCIVLYALSAAQKVFFIYVSFSKYLIVLFDRKITLLYI